MTFDIQNGVLKRADGSDTHAVIPDSVTVLGEYAFYYCPSLQSVSIPHSVTVIGDYAFAHCTDLQSVSIPDSVTSIGESAFECCISLTSVSIPDSVTSIGACAFESCISLASVFIPNSVTSIGESAFLHCTALRISISSDHPHFLFENDMLISVYGTLVLASPDITDARIPDSVTAIGESAFSCCAALASVSIPRSVTSIEGYAFSICPSLESISVPDSVTSIGEFAFSSCTALQSVSIPHSVSSIGEYAFSSCPALKSIRLSSRHFDFSRFHLKNALTAAKVITCIEPLCLIPESCRPQACLGFVLHKKEYPESLHREYLDYIRTHPDEICDAAVGYPESIRLLCRDKLIDFAAFPIFLEKTLRLGLTELTALLLEYKHKRLSDCGSPKEDHWDV